MKIYRKEKGVSEVLGSILILLITVVLFSSVFYYVSTMPTPKSQIYAQFDASLNIELNQTTGEYYLNITVRNMGGESLVDWRTMFIVVIDFTAKQHMLSENNFADQLFDKDHKFSQGESFHYYSYWDKWNSVNWTNESEVKHIDVSVSLYDKSNGRVIWSSKLQGYGNLPPILIALNTHPAPVILGKSARFKAIVFDPDNEDISKYNVTLDFSSSILKYTINGNSLKKMYYAGHGSFVTNVEFSSNDSLNISHPYPVRTWIDDGVLNRSYVSYIYLSRGTESIEPDLYVNSTLITLSNPNPVHGRDVTVTVIVGNRGGTNATFRLKVEDIYPGYPKGRIYIQVVGESGYINSSALPSQTGVYRISAAGQVPISFTWHSVGTDADGKSYAHVAGLHKLRIEIIDIKPEERPENKFDDAAEVNVMVAPRILLVDDDRAPLGSTLDVGRYYKYILDTCGHSYDVRENYGSVPAEILNKYDLVIWETGYRDHPLENDGSSQAQVLNDFLTSGGALWLISPGISANSLNTIDSGIVDDVSQEYTGNIIAQNNSYVNLTLHSGNLLSDELVNRIDIISGVSPYNVVYVKEPGHTSKAEILISTEDGKGLAIGDIIQSGNRKGKLVFMGFELSRVKHYYSQNFIGYRILQWLGNLTGRIGNDVAVEDLIVTPSEPFYQQPVKITIVVSNNGATNISTKVLLEIDGRIPSNITADPIDTGIIPPDGGYVEVNFTWTPQVPGTHLITAIVDPYNEIKETNEENNVLNTEIINTEVFVRFSTLIVFNSKDSSSQNTKQKIADALSYLGYANKELDLSGTKPSDYESGRYFARYNLVIWANCVMKDEDVTAIENSLQFTLHPGYLFMGPKLLDNENFNNLLSGNDLEIFASPASLSKDAVLYGVNNASNNPASVTNGLALVVNSVSYNITINGASLSQGLFWKYKEIDTNKPYWDYENISVEEKKLTDINWGYGVAAIDSSERFKLIILPFTLENVKGIFGVKVDEDTQPYAPKEQAQSLLMFRLLKWFGYWKNTPELATYSSDISIIYGGENPHMPPIVGRSYKLTTKVYNYGAVGCNAIVRFYNDYEWIGSSTVYLPPANFTKYGIIQPSITTVEIKWTPMFAGYTRHIRVIIEPSQPETLFNTTGSNNGKNIFNFNNEALRTYTVYYFWDNIDNMVKDVNGELADENWIHEATLAYISGESPLDFLNREDVSTNVTGDWDWIMSGSSDSEGTTFKQGTNVFYTDDANVEAFTSGTSHSAPKAFWIPEAPRAAYRKPIDVIFVIDTSGSMSAQVPGADVGDINHDGVSNSRLDVAISAAENATKLLGENDRVAIFDFKVTTSGSDVTTTPQKVLDFTDVGTEFDKIDAALKNIKLTYSNYYRDYVGSTPLYDTSSWAVYYMDDKGDKNSVKGIIILTDGLSNTDTKSGDQYKYAPGTGKFETEPGPIQYYTNDNGLLQIPYSVMAISIAPDGWDGRLFPIGNSSTGNVSMALFESKPENIKGAFVSFISLLIQTSSTGGIRATPPDTFDSADKLKASNTIENLGVVVFSDGFRDESWSSPGWDGSWTHSNSFTISSTGHGNYYYKSQSSSGPQDTYWVAQTSTEGAYLGHPIYPGKVLEYHYPGKYTIKKAELRFWVGMNEDDNDYPDATIKVYVGNTEIDIPHILDGSSSDVYATNYHIHYIKSTTWWNWKYEAYITVYIPVLVNEYNMKIEVVSTKDTIGIDDVMVVYYIDYTPPTSGSSSNVIPQEYVNAVDTHVNWSYLITPEISISTQQVEGLELSFWTKYWITEGTNGGVVYLWVYDSSNDKWTWDKDHRAYLIPKQSYTGNLMMGTETNPIGVDKYKTSGGPRINGDANGLQDKDGNLPYWCFNGRSGDGTFDWDYIEISLDKYISWIISNGGKFRIVFLYAQLGGISPSMGWNPARGWYLDDVRITITGDGQRDLWKLENMKWDEIGAHSGEYAWVYNDTNGNLPHGIDASLITKQIDLSTARSAMLDFYIRFNLNPAAGVPPATVRVEVSDDNGMTWSSITYGVRIGWGYTGDGDMGGTLDSGGTGYGWVSSSTLARINCDLSGWAGRSILIRFRVATNATTPQKTWDPQHSDYPHGVFLDDVVVYGEGYAESIATSQDYYLWES